MSRRRKLEKFAQLLKYEHVYEMIKPGSELLRQTVHKDVVMKGIWKEYAYHNNQPLCLELACGRGEYSLGLSRLFPEKNFLGVDIKGARIYQGATTALQEGLSNVAFLRIRIEQIDLYFALNEIDEIWITFPDPFKGKPNRRLSAKPFLDTYYKLLSKGASIHLKTDDLALYEYSVEVAEEHKGYRIVEQSDNISEMRLLRSELNIHTYYERKHILNNLTIKYLHLEKID